LNLKPWILAARPKTLWAAIAPVLIGTALAIDDGRFHFLSALVALVGAILIQIGTNFANDYYDYIKGSDTKERLGPTRATAAGLVKPDSMKRAFIFVFAVAAILGSYLVYRAGMPIVIIGGLSILFAITYTAGPFPLGYNGLGDIFVFIFFGLVAVGGTYYVQAQEIKTIVIAAGIAPGLFSTAILTVNNLRDINQDKDAGKKTLAVRWGTGFAKTEYIFCIVGACLMPLVLVYVARDHYYSLFSAATLFLAVPFLKIIIGERPSTKFNAVLAQTGKMLLLYSLLFSVGWII
jgi:1,4-dihydroxy-2-naphthoate polyprenyltransferase